MKEILIYDGVFELTKFDTQAEADAFRLAYNRYAGDAATEVDESVWFVYETPEGYETICGSKLRALCPDNGRLKEPAAGPFWSEDLADEWISEAVYQADMKFLEANEPEVAEQIKSEIDAAVVQVFGGANE